MECCIGVSVETVLQVVKSYIVVNWEKITNIHIHSDEGLQSKTSLF